MSLADLFCRRCDALIEMMVRKGTGYCSTICEKTHDPEAWAKKTARKPL